LVEVAIAGGGPQVRASSLPGSQIRRRLTSTGKGGTLVEVIFAETGKAGKGALSLGGTAISDSRGKALSRTLSLGKAYTVR